MKKPATALFSAFLLILTHPALAAPASGAGLGNWWTLLIVLIGLGLALTLWDEFIRSICQIKKSLCNR